LDARAEMTDFALALQRAQPVENLAFAQNLRRDAVQLRQVQRLDAEPFERCLGGRAHAGLRVVIWVKRAAPEFCRHEKTLPRALFEKSPDQALAAPAAIDISRVEKIHARIHRCGEDVE